MGDGYAILFRPFFLNDSTIAIPTFLDISSELHKANNAGPEPEIPQPIAPLFIAAGWTR